jgi:hypothetical protein
VRAVVDRHVVPDELPQVLAQRSLRRSQAGRFLRGEAVDALRLGGRLGRGQPDEHGGERILVVQPPVDRTLEGSSSWLRVAREKAAERRTAPHDAADPGKLVIARAFRRARRLEPASAPLAAEPESALADQAMMTQRTAVYPAQTSADESGKDPS